MPDLSAVRGFINERNVKTKQQEVTFHRQAYFVHRIPKHKVKRQAWTMSLRRGDFDGNDCSVLCSRQHKAEDVDMTGQTTHSKEGVILPLPDHLWKVPSRSRSNRT